MKGIDIKNFCEGLEHNEELEFEYNGSKYIIQPEVDDNEECWLVIYTADQANGQDFCIVREANTSNIKVEKEVVDKVLNTKCFEGKSFFEIYNDIEIIDWF